MEDLDIKSFEINSDRSIENPNLESPKDVDYMKFLKSLLPKSEPSSSLDEGFDYNLENNDMDPQYKMFLDNSEVDGESYKLEISMKNGTTSVMYEGKNNSEPSSSLDEGFDYNLENNDMDPQYKMFLDNSEVDGESYKLEISMKNGTTSVMYEGKNNSDKDCDLKTIPAEKYAEKHGNQNVGSNTGGERDDVNEVRNMEAEATKFTSLSLIRETRMCNSIEGSTKNMRNKVKGTTRKFVKDDPKSRGVKDLKNASRREHVETRNILKNGACDTSMDTENTRGREKRKRAKRVQAKIDMLSSKRSGAKGSRIFGLDWQQEINADDVDECYQMFLNSAKIEGDSAVYAVEGQKPVKQEALDVICFYDSEILVTSNAFEFNEGYPMPENEQQCLVSQGGGFDTQFKTKLMDKLGEPYNGREYKKLWNEFNKERRKVKHKDLRGSGAGKSFSVDELSPSYNDRYALLSRKIVAAGSELQRLQYLRGFFFWLQNVAHENAFEPWIDKSCLEVIQKTC